jgi:hypothetical protein
VNTHNAVSTRPAKHPTNNSGGSTSVPFESNSDCDTLPLYQEQAVNGGFSNRAHKGRGAKERYGSKGAKMQTDSFVGSGSSPQGASSLDLVFENHFSLFLIRPVSPAGQTWLDENVGDSETQTWCGAVVCEPRFAPDVCRGAIEAGLTVQL